MIQLAFRAWRALLRGHSDGVRRILFVGSGPDALVKTAAAALRRIYPDAEIHSFAAPMLDACRQPGFQPLPAERIACLRLALRLGKMGYETCAVIVDGDTAFARHWFVGLLSGARYNLIFNENGDAFWLSRDMVPTLCRIMVQRSAVGNPNELKRAAMLPVGLIYLAIRAAYWKLQWWRNHGKVRIVHASDLTPAEIEQAEGAAAPRVQP